jgi:glyoxylase-like metal-dependent hydrolase (beta-lactamase superfamily II)
MKLKNKVPCFINRSLHFALLLLITIFPSLSAADQKITKVTEKIFTITEGSIVNSNTTFIVSNDGVLVVDTRPNPDEALKVLNEIRKVTSKPIKYVFNTHFHGDHLFGNQIFAEASAIIAHKNVRLFLEETGKEHLDFFKKMGTPGLEDTRIIIPDIAYHKGLDIIFGEFNLQVRHLGKGHTDSDTIIYLPEEKILIAGDIIFNNKIPFAGHAFISEWLKRVEELEKFDASTIIPGHGAVGDKAIIKAMKQYLSELKSNVMERVKKGKTLEETKAEVKKVMDKYKTGWKVM